MMQLTGKNIVVAGLGVTGVAVARFLSGRGAAVTATDMASEKDLGSGYSSFRHRAFHWNWAGIDPRPLKKRT